MRTFTLERFETLWTALGASGSGKEVFHRLELAYWEPHRAYHTAAHIAACLALFDEPTVWEIASFPDEVEAALWFHDAIYDPRASDNEERSAVLAEFVLSKAGVANAKINRIINHILSTKDHLFRSWDSALVIDIDLSILGMAPETYALFEQEIRQEYAWVDERAYRVGRSVVLRNFLDRKILYNSTVLRDRYEAQARVNLAEALRSLAS